MVTRASDDFVDPKSLTKWTALGGSRSDQQQDALEVSKSAARAKATKARLAELESDMFERSEKQQARENRSAQLRRFMAESNIEQSSSVQQQSSSSSSQRTEKRVNF